MQHLSKLVHGGASGGLVEQAALGSQCGAGDTIAVGQLLDATLDHHRLLLPHPVVHLQSHAICHEKLYNSHKSVTKSSLCGVSVFQFG